MGDMTAGAPHDTSFKRPYINNLKSRKLLGLFGKKGVRTEEDTEHRGVCFVVGLWVGFQVLLTDRSISRDTLNIPEDRKSVV